MARDAKEKQNKNRSKKMETTLMFGWFLSSVAAAAGFVIYQLI
jgi:hypothetical protein